MLVNSSIRCLPGSVIVMKQDRRVRFDVYLADVLEHADLPGTPNAAASGLARIARCTLTLMLNSGAVIFPMSSLVGRMSP